eukprot:753220-Hanusia_phi.AAC.1
MAGRSDAMEDAGVGIYEDVEDVAAIDYEEDEEVGSNSELDELENDLQDLENPQAIPPPWFDDSSESSEGMSDADDSDSDVQGNDRAELSKCFDDIYPLPYDAYKVLCSELMHFPSKDFIAARAFLMLCWNLMSRTKNSNNIQFDHLSWQNDHMRFLFDNEKPRDPPPRPRKVRRVYANPKSPEICPILAMGIYFLSVEQDERLLFAPSPIHKRFWRLLRSIVRPPRGGPARGARSSEDLTKIRRLVAQELAARHIRPIALGSDSIQKGSCMYCIRVQSEPPSADALFHGPTPTAQVTDLDHGDGFVGRAVAGLPLNTAEFARLPPHFEECDHQDVDKTLQKLFPRCSPQLRKVMEHCMASVVYQLDFLKTRLDSQHPLWKSKLFEDVVVLERLKSRVKCCLVNETTWMVATGVPPAIIQALYNQRLTGERDRFHDELMKKNMQMFSLQTDLSSNLEVSGLQQAAGGTVKRSGDELKDVYNDGLSSLLAKHAKSEKSGQQAAKSCGVKESPHTFDKASINQMSLHGSLMEDFFQRIDELMLKNFAFTLPASFILAVEVTSCESGWNLWFFGCSAKGCPPLKDVKNSEVQGLQQRRILGYLSLFVRAFFRHIKLKLSTKKYTTLMVDRIGTMVREIQSNPKPEAVRTIFAEFYDSFYAWLLGDTSVALESEELTFVELMKLLKKKGFPGEK